MANAPVAYTNPASLEEFEVNPSQISNINLGSTNTHYQVSNIIIQDSTRTGILQFFPTHTPETTAPTPDQSQETSMRPNRSGGQNDSSIGRPGDVYG